jgi:hypothetical protein
MGFQRLYRSYIQRNFNDHFSYNLICTREYLGCHPYKHPKPNSIFHFVILLCWPENTLKNQTISVEEAELIHNGSMGVELNDYPASGANKRHSPHSEGTRWIDSLMFFSHVTRNQRVLSSVLRDLLSATVVPSSCLLLMPRESCLFFRSSHIARHPVDFTLFLLAIRARTILEPAVGYKPLPCHL